MFDEHPAGLACPGEDVDHAGWEVGLLADVGEGQRSEGGRLSGLEDDRVSARERGCDLPGEHEKREVPRDDLRGYTEGLRVVTEPGEREFVRPPRVVEEVSRSQGNVDIT